MTPKLVILGLVIGGGGMVGHLSSPVRPPLIFACEVIGANASLESLQQAFGTSDIAEDSLPLGDTEGDMVPATTFFATDANRRIGVVWKDRARRQSPKYVQLGPDATGWKTPQGITLGTSLKELERLNGRPFRLAGFGFDGSGAVISWNGGKLAILSSTICQLQMNLGWIDASPSVGQKWSRQVTGDREFSSGHPAMQAINPRISNLRLVFP